MCLRKELQRFLIESAMIEKINKKWTLADPFKNVYFLRLAGKYHMKISDV